MAEIKENAEEKRADIIDEIKGRAEQIIDRHADDLAEAEDQLREGVLTLAGDIADAKLAPTFNEEDVNAAFEDWMGEVEEIPEEIVNEIHAFRETIIEECMEEK